jgi:hypothetical protein
MVFGTGRGRLHNHPIYIQDLEISVHGNINSQEIFINYQAKQKLCRNGIHTLIEQSADPVAMSLPRIELQLQCTVKYIKFNPNKCQCSLLDE